MPVTAPPERAPRTILVVDDDDDLAEAFTRALGRRGFVTHRARTGAEAIAMLGGVGHLDEALVDLVLPGAGGIEVVQHLRQAHPECHIVAVTGLASPAVERAFRDAGADAFLAKPVSLPDLYVALGVDPA